MDDDPRVFLCHDAQQVLGPFTTLELQAKVRIKSLSRDALACEEGSESWVPVASIRAGIFRSRAGPPNERQQALMRYLGHPHPASVSSKEGNQWLDEAESNPEYAALFQQWKSDRFALHPDLFEKAVPPAATERQQALMSYLGHPSPHALSSYEASEWLDQEREQERNQERLDKWRKDRLRLHPELFAAELQQQKIAHDERQSNRSSLIRSFCNSEKELYEESYPLKRLTHEHANRAVAWLDGNRPGWDAELWNGPHDDINEDVVSTHFFQALVKAVPEAVKDKDWALGWNESASGPSAGSGSSRKSQSKPKRGCLRLLFWIGAILLLLLIIGLMGR
jgi:GYF domain 2